MIKHKMTGETICYLCHTPIDTTIKFILFSDGCAHQSCFDADYTGYDVIDLDRMLVVKPGGVLEPYAGEEDDEFVKDILRRMPWNSRQR